MAGSTWRGCLSFWLGLGEGCNRNELGEGNVFWNNGDIPFCDISHFDS